MLFISGHIASLEGSDSLPSFNLVIEMLFISGGRKKLLKRVNPRFNLVIEMLFISGEAEAWARREHEVSISSSRCFSFQGVASLGSFGDGTVVSIS